MDSAYQERIRRRLELPLHEGPDRTATSDELGLIRLFDPRRYLLG